MKLTLAQKRALLRITDPLFKALYFMYRLASWRLWRRRAISDAARKVLVVRLDSIGDVLLSEPAIAALHRRFKQARIDMVVSPEGRDVLSRNPAIDSFVIYEVPWHGAWRGKRVNWKDELRAIFGVLRRLRRERYDIAFELRGDFRDIAFAVAAGAQIVVGSGWRGGGFLPDYDVPLDEGQHRVNFALSIAAVSSNEYESHSPRIFLGRAERAAVVTYLGQSGDATWVALHLGAGFATKCLPLPKFVEAAMRLRDMMKETELRFVLVGGPSEAELAARFKERFKCSVVDLVGKLTIMETAAVLERCRLFIGNDSAPMHLAAAVGTPVVAFFGPSDPRYYRPYGVEHKVLELEMPCRPCDHVHCAHQENLCLSQIEVDDIISAAAEMLLPNSLEVR